MTGVQVLFFLILFIAALLALFGALPSLWVVCLIFIAGVLAFLSFRKTRKLDEQVQDLETAVDEIERDLQAKVDVILLEQEQQATLMSAISDAILAVDQEGNLLFYNSRFAMLFGGSTFNPQSRLKELFREPEILMAFETAFREGKMSQIKATPWTSTAGQLFFSLSVSPLRTLDAEKGGEIYGAVGVFHDVTDLKHAEQMRIDFVANVSHELRTPLTAIKGYTDTLYEDIGAGRPLQKEFLEIIHRNSNRLMSLIQDLLDLSALESTEILQKTEVSTEEVTKRVLQQLQGVFEAKKQKIKFQGGAPVVWADPRRVEQVLVNLLDNANKYTPEGGEVSVTWQRDLGSKVLLKIQDTGPGISPEHHARLFERFYRVDKARSREMGGTGLGLAIVKHIMQRHDGQVWVESTLGKGSVFICQFPE